MNRVSPHYRGVWQRLSLQVAGGERDTSTQVYWLQTPSLYGDIRVPADRPDFSGRRSLQDFDDTELAWLTRQKGFAGLLEAEGDICRWHREVDYQPSTGEDDVGHMHFEGPLLVETGVDREYEEEWRRLTSPDAPYVALELISEIDALGPNRERTGYVLVVGDYFLYVRGRRGALPPGPSLADVTNSARCSRQCMLDLLDFEISFGRCQGADVPWRIELSTLPFREGQPLFTPDTAPVPRSGVDGSLYYESREGRLRRHWTVREWSAGFDWFG